MELRRFFHWLVLSQTLGFSAAILLVSFIQQNYSFFYGYVLALVSMIVSLLIFVLGSVRYEKPEPCMKKYSSLFEVIKFVLSKDARINQREGIQKQ